MEANLCITFETSMKMLKQRTQMRNRDEDLRKSVGFQSVMNFSDAQRDELPPWDYNTRRVPPRPVKRLSTFDDGDLLAPPEKRFCLGLSKKRKRGNDDDDENEEQDRPAKCQKRNQGYCITENDYEGLEVLIKAQDQHKASSNPVVTVVGSRPPFTCIEYMLCFMIAILSIYVRLLFSWISGFYVFPDALDTLSE